MALPVLRARASRDRKVDLLPQTLFLKMLQSEQSRCERSRKACVLALIEIDGPIPRVVEKLLHGISQSSRETDVVGWFREGSVVGVIFTEIDLATSKSIADLLMSKTRTAVTTRLNADEIHRIHYSVHVFPSEASSDENSSSSPDGGIGTRSRFKDISATLKRSIDVTGSLLVVILLSPLFILIALTVKLTSKGPILFKQKRVGLYGRHFTFLKFRTMYTANNEALHREYVKQFISGAVGDKDGQDQNGRQLYKIVRDPRITPVGRFLRRTSLDEFPQFLNVLVGDMSLVGPRPPIPYEVENYDIWHKRRFLSIRPGITGLWQVKGRSRTSFDEMVRMDLRYARSWTLWLDLKILIQTPFAVLKGDGAC